MKFSKVLIAFIVLFSVLTVGCSYGHKIKGNTIIVEKQVKEISKYEFYKEIKDSKDVKNAKSILAGIKWENAKVNMVRPSDYKFHFDDTTNYTSGPVYELWISPDKDKIELVVNRESKYAQLSKEKSQELFKILTGKNLGEE